MITRARRRLAKYADRVALHHGDAADLRATVGAADVSYDAVFDFAIIHHIPNWRDAIAEIARVLRPGGRFYFDEVTAHALARPTYRALFDHPTADRFTAEDFRAELHRHNLHTGDRFVTRIHGDYLLGVAHRRVHEQSGTAATAAASDTEPGTQQAAHPTGRSDNEPVLPT